MILSKMKQGTEKARKRHEKGKERGEKNGCGERLRGPEAYRRRGKKRGGRWAQ